MKNNAYLKVKYPALMKIVILCLCCLLSMPIWGAERFVGVGGINSGECTSFVSPCGKIQYAIDISNAGDVIRVKPGKYTENIDFQGKEITVTSIRGAKETIIDGSRSATVVKFINNESNNSVIEGFTIQNGYGEACSYEGGGITIFSSSPVIKNCILRWNKVNSNGGGIFIDHAQPIIENSVIVRNFGMIGGIFVTDSSLSVINSKIIGNDGVGIWIQYSTASIFDTEIKGNTVGGMVVTRSNVSVINNTITGNSGGFGAGIAVGEAKVNIINTTISGNHASLFGLGGTAGIFIGKSKDLPSSVTIINSIIWNNVGNDYNGVVGISEIYDAAEHAYSLEGVLKNRINIAFSDINLQWLHGIGNIRMDPKFRSPRGPESAPDVGGDYHITGDSPCIDKGTSSNETYPLLPLRDRDYDIRPFGESYDMGSDEYDWLSRLRHRRASHPRNGGG